MDSAQLADRLEVGDWHVLIYLRWDGLERRFAGRAELFLAGVFRCRIALGRDSDLADEALASLRDRAKKFIDDWQQREHRADSEFSEL